MPQKPRSYKIKPTDEMITSQAGLVQFGEMLHRLEVPRLLNSIFCSKEEDNSGSNSILPLLLMYVGGGKRISDIREIQQEPIYKELQLWNKNYTYDALLKWLKRKSDLSHLFCKMMTPLLQKALDSSLSYTLDIDAYFLESEKFSSKIGHKGKGFYPLASHMNGYLVDLELRTGNESPAKGLIDAVERISNRLTKEQISILRSDSAGYQSEIFNFCEKKGWKFVIAARKDASVIATLNQIPEEDWINYDEEHQIASTIHSMEDSLSSFRLVALRKKKMQMSFMQQEEENSCYRFVLATNTEHSNQALLRFYRKRGEDSENKIKEMKQGFGMDYLPFSDHFKGNELVMFIQALAYNLTLWMKQNIFPKAFQKHQVVTLRWKFFMKAGKLVKHARNYYFKVKRDFLDCYKRIKAQIERLHPLLE